MNPLCLVNNEDFVDSVMAPGCGSLCAVSTSNTFQVLADVHSSSDQGSRKRHFSDIGNEKNDITVIGSNKKSCSNIVSKGNTSDLRATHDTMFNSELILNMSTLFENLSEKFDKLHRDLTLKMERLESNLEAKLTEKLSSLIDTKLQERCDSVRTEILNEVKSVTSRNMGELKDRVEGVEKSYIDVASKLKVNRELNLVIRNLPESEREKSNTGVTKDKTLSLIRNGLKLRNVKIISAERKQSKNNKPGVVIATVENLQQKKDIFIAKRMLKSSHTYEDVFIENDLPYDQRVHSSNMSTILKEIGKSDSFTLHRGRIVKRDTRFSPERRGQRAANHRRRTPSPANHRRRSPGSPKHMNGSDVNRRNVNKNRSNTTPDSRHDFFGHNSDTNSRGVRR